MADHIDSLSDAELQTKLAEHGLPVMPITATTRKLLVKKLKLKLLSDKKNKPRKSLDAKPGKRRSLAGFSRGEGSDLDTSNATEKNNRRASTVGAMLPPPARKRPIRDSPVKGVSEDNMKPIRTREVVTTVTTRRVTRADPGYNQDDNMDVDEKGDTYRKISPPPNKKTKINPWAEDSHPTNYTQSIESNTRVLPSTSSAEFLIKPRQARQIDLGKINTSTDRKPIRNAAQRHVDELMKLQNFNTDEWKEVKYANILQTYLAKPGFVELEINDELGHLVRDKDPNRDHLTATERAMAGLTHGLLEHKEIIRKNLQDLVNWANHSPSELTFDNLYEKIMALFGPSSRGYANLDEIIKLVCGKRSECVELRREQIIAGIPDRHLQNTLRDLPPSAEHLFDHNSLKPVMRSLWLNRL